MSWNDLARIGATVRPLQDPKPPAGLTILTTELRALAARNVVIEIDVREQDLRIDGLPRSTARPEHPGVAVAFESRHGPLRYATAEYASAWGASSGSAAWAQNLRAIALSMQALRAVDRYGVSKRGEQYQGWRALPISTDTGIETREQAEAFLNGYGGLTAAIKATHPDAGGKDDDFRKVMRAKELIGG